MAELPRVVLAASVPAADAVVFLTRAADGATELLGTAGFDATGVLTREKAKGDAGEIVQAPLDQDQKVLLAGIGDGSPAAWRKTGAALVRRSKSATSLALDLRSVDLDAAALRGLVTGLTLAAYGFTQKANAEPRTLTDITLVVAKPAAHKAALASALALVEATASCRDLINTPPMEKSPQWLATEAVSLLKDLKPHVRDDKQLKAEGWGGVVAVGMGSSRPPRVVEACYDGGGKRHVVLVGKGITFDTGGISIKPNAGMLTMKMDMGGAAAVLATVRAVADLKLPIKVTAIACVAENMPSGAAQRPSDVITQYGGTTVEVLNTDAEGRLVLADGIAYADRALAADVIIDIATLTGAMPIALGQKTAGLFTDDDALAGQLLAAASECGERLWRMPLVDDYRVSLDSTTADLRNISEPKLKLQGGSIVAGLFLREFAGGRSWAHLDIAGPAWSGSEDEELTKGGTGYGVRLLTTWLEQPATTATKAR
ncbi:MAG: Leucyl aminopeptidase [Frankiales bacterium]|nr:Leucyl aminopeptidase [Frankiales bacterium]